MSKFCHVLLLGGILLVGACAGYNPNQNALTGAVLGGAAGGVLGHQMNHDKGAYIGGATGALLGGALGTYLDQVRGFDDRMLQPAPKYGYR
jgi:uncharacterized protein YcfJ